MNKWFSSLMKGKLKKSKIVKNAYEYSFGGLLCTVELRQSTFLTGREQRVVVVTVYVLDDEVKNNENLHLVFESMVVNGLLGWREAWRELDHWDETEKSQKELKDVLCNVVIPWIKATIKPERMIDFLISMHDEEEVADTVVSDKSLLEILTGMKSQFPSRMWTLNYIAVSYLFERLGDYENAIKYIGRHKLKVERIFSNDKKLLVSNLEEVDCVLKRIEFKKTVVS